LNSSIQFCAASDQGKVRRNNEDYFALDASLGLAVVADGMGGHAAGEIASRAASEFIRAQARGEGPQGADEAPEAKLRRWIEGTNREVVRLNEQASPRSDMGTTIVAALAAEDVLAVAHVGDSRAYLFRAGKLERLTRDHSVVEEQISHGLIAPENAADSPFANVLTRALGSSPEVVVDVSRVELRPSDVVLLATDGLTRMLPDARIAAELASPAPPEELVRRLIAAANEAGGTDNITVVLGVCR
jgi:protein phosphatase